MSVVVFAADRQPPRLRTRTGETPAWLDGRARPRPNAGDPGYSGEGYELPDGGVIEWPDENGAIRMRDPDGDLVDFWEPGEDGWQQAADLFGVTAADYEPVEDDDTLWPSLDDEDEPSR